MNEGIGPFETVSLVEAIFTTIAFIGLFVVGSNISNAARDMFAAMVARVNGDIGVMTWNTFRNELVSMFTLMAFFVIGMMYSLTPQNPSIEANVTSTIVGIMFVLVEVAIVTNSYYNRRDKELLRMSRERKRTQLDTDMATGSITREQIERSK